MYLTILQRIKLKLNLVTQSIQFFVQPDLLQWGEWTSKTSQSRFWAITLSFFSKCVCQFDQPVNFSCMYLLKRKKVS